MADRMNNDSIKKAVRKKLGDVIFIDINRLQFLLEIIVVFDDHYTQHYHYNHEKLTHVHGNLAMHQIQSMKTLFTED